MSLYRCSRLSMSTSVRCTGSTTLPGPRPFLSRHVTDSSNSTSIRTKPALRTRNSFLTIVSWRGIHSSRHLLNRRDNQQDTAPFEPRRVFVASDSITRSYYLGHHASALKEMVKILTSINLVIECRDSRVPLTATNQKLEEALAGRERIVVYTKSDLSVASHNKTKAFRQCLQDFHDGKFPALDSDDVASIGLKESTAQDILETDIGPGSTQTASPELEQVEDNHDPFEARYTDNPDSSPDSYHPQTRIILSSKRADSTKQIINLLKDRAANHDSLIGIRALIVGMPNAGKSTLLNSLRQMGVKGSRAAKTGSEPGVTRKIQSPVRVTEPEPGDSPVLVYDTPGVFVPYVGDVESMLKLSLVGCVKDGLVPMLTLADYLLFRLNLWSPASYKKWSVPTNDVMEWLGNIGMRNGMLQKGGGPSHDKAADWIVQHFRKGNLGQFCLDDLSPGAQRQWAQKLKLAKSGGGPMSLTQAKKVQKEQRKAYKAEAFSAKSG